MNKRKRNDAEYHTSIGADDVAVDAEEDEEPLEVCKPKT